MEKAGDRGNNGRDCRDAMTEGSASHILGGSDRGEGPRTHKGHGYIYICAHGFYMGTSVLNRSCTRSSTWNGDRRIVFGETNALAREYNLQYIGTRLEKIWS